MKRLPESLSGLLAGFLFGVGLSVSQMTNPEKVLAFLDVLGGWDPSLVLTMGGALLVTTIGYRFVLNSGPVFGEKLHLPTRTDVDTRLLTGAGLFGLGWGIAGYCPGPAIAAVAVNPTETLIFVASMVAGALLQGAFDRSGNEPSQDGAMGGAGNAGD